MDIIKTPRERMRSIILSAARRHDVTYFEIVEGSRQTPVNAARNEAIVEMTEQGFTRDQIQNMLGLSIDSVNRARRLERRRTYRDSRRPTHQQAAE
jgi:hypothetical protein